VTTNDRNLPTFVFARICSVAFLFDEKRRKSREKKTREGDALKAHPRIEEDLRISSDPADRGKASSRDWETT
jgi:hypothetical protein